MSWENDWAWPQYPGPCAVRLQWRWTCLNWEFREAVCWKKKRKWQKKAWKIEEWNNTWAAHHSNRRSAACSHNPRSCDAVSANAKAKSSESFEACFLVRFMKLQSLLMGKSCISPLFVSRCARMPTHGSTQDVGELYDTCNSPWATIGNLLICDLRCGWMYDNSPRDARNLLVCNFVHHVFATAHLRYPFAIDVGKLCWLEEDYS